MAGLPSIKAQAQAQAQGLTPPARLQNLKGSTTPSSSIARCGPSIQAREPLGDFSHSNHRTKKSMAVVIT